MSKDPRLSDDNKSVNDEIQDRIIRHQVYMQGYETRVSNNVNKFLDEKVFPDLLRQIEKRLNTITATEKPFSKLTTRRLLAMKKFLEGATKKMSVEIMDNLIEELDLLASQEIGWTVGMINQETPVKLNLITPSTQSVVSSIYSKPFAGETMAQWFGTFAAATETRLTRAIQAGVIEGQTTQQITQRIVGTRANKFKDGVLNTTRNQATALARTAVSHVANQSRNDVFLSNSDIIKGVQWVSTLDTRTSVICQNLDGDILPIDKGIRPPAHVNCRSTITPVLKSSRSIGLGTRSSMNGQVPSSTTYGEWLKGQPLSVQEDVLGKTKAKLFRSGGLTIDKFSNKNLQPLTLEQLLKKEPIAFEKANV